MGHLAGGTAASGLVGGLAAVAGGGKFANGAQTAAFGYLFNQAAGKFSLAEPDKNDVVIIINRNGNWVGTHAGMIVRHWLYDPGGNFVYDNPNADTTLNNYVEYQLKDGSDVLVYRFKLGDADADRIYKNINSIPGSAGFCAANVQTCIAGIGPFKSIEPTWFTSPRSLAFKLNGVASGSCAMAATGKPC